MPYEERIQLLGGRRDGAEAPDEDQEIVCSSIEDVQREALRAERRWIVRLRDEGIIGDDVFRRVEQDLDLEESKLTG
jgi:hypothetical protein